LRDDVHVGNPFGVAATTTMDRRPLVGAVPIDP
jgi:hypothetical protein